MESDVIKQELIKQNVELLRFSGKEIYLVGTAHISKESVDLAEELIREIKPDVVAIELCKSRYESLKDPERWKKTNIVTVIRQGRAAVLLVQLLLASFQKKLGNKLQIKPGLEMMRAASVAEEVGARVVLADRDIKVTLKRTWKQIGLWTIVKLFTSWLRSLFEHKEITKDQIERLKSPDVLEELMEEFTQAMPEVKESLIVERDKYLSQKIKDSPGQRIVAVVGAGHIKGIKSWIQEDIDLSPLETVPPRSPLKRILRWSVLGLFLLVVLFAFIRAGSHTGIQILSSWFWVTAISGAIGSAICLAHPLTIVAAFISAPFTTFPPLLAAGWVAGLVEAILKKPKVSDFEGIIDDISSLRGLWTNRVSRILLIMALTNIATAIGAAWGAKIIVSLL